jgi:hypothetical protein
MPMDLVSRVKNICLTPATEWDVIERETVPAGTLITGYVLPLAGVSALAGFVGGSIIGGLVFGRTPIVAGLVIACLTMILAVVTVWIVAFIIDALAPSFGAQKNSAQAFKLAVYSFTPAWVAGVLNILPLLGMLAVLGGLYGIYLMYLGIPRLMKCPQDRAAGYTIVVVICAIVVSALLSLFSGLIVAGSLIGGGALSGLGGGGGDSGAVFSPNSTLGRLEQSIDETARKMEAAEKSGDPNAQAAAALEGLGALLGGGRRVEPVQIDQIKVFMPETFMGLPLQPGSSSAERTGMAGVMVARAEATYADGPRSVTLQIVDSGGASGLMGLASWIGVQEERETDDRVERTRRVGGRLVHEQRSKTGGQHEYGLLLADRFMVTARGNGVEFGALEAAVHQLDLDRIEAMREVGVQ